MGRSPVQFRAGAQEEREEKLTQKQRREQILANVKNLAAQLAADPLVMEAVAVHEPTISEMVMAFEKTLRQQLPVRPDWDPRPVEDIDLGAHAMLPGEET